MDNNPIAATLAALLLGSASMIDAALAADAVRHAGRNVTYPKSLEFTVRDEASKRAAGTFEREGMTFHTEGPRAGEISTIVITGSFDFTAGVGPYEARIVRTFDDGDTVTIDIQGERQRGAGQPTNSGTYTCVAGTGTLEGAACAGRYTSTLLANRMSVVDWDGTLTVPSS